LSARVWRARFSPAELLEQKVGVITDNWIALWENDWSRFRWSIAGFCRVQRLKTSGQGKQITRTSEA